jgi:hypothetical protein
MNDVKGYLEIKMTLNMGQKPDLEKQVVCSAMRPKGWAFRLPVVSCTVSAAP